MLHIFKWILLLSAVVLLSQSCAQKFQTISARIPSNIEKSGTGPLYIHQGDHGKQTEPPAIYIKKKDFHIVPKEQKNDTGSLVNLNDEQNYLIMTNPDPTRLGKNILVEVIFNRINSLLPPVKSPASPKANLTAQKQEKPASETDKKEQKTELKATDNKTTTNGGADEIQELLKAFPNLGPSDSGILPIKYFQMQIAQKSENGDVLLLMQRRSTRDNYENLITVQAILPYQKLVDGKKITTNDLTAVQWLEAKDGEIIERSSVGWEDEYTLRLSSFDEAKSKMAMELEDKRKQLISIQQNLDTKVKALSSERQQFAKQREEIFSKQQEQTDKMAELEKTVKDQEDKIKSLEEKDGASLQKETKAEKVDNNAKAKKKT